MINIKPFKVIPGTGSTEPAGVGPAKVKELATSENEPVDYEAHEQAVADRDIVLPTPPVVADYKPMKLKE